MVSSVLLRWHGGSNRWREPMWALKAKMATVIPRIGEPSNILRRWTDQHAASRDLPIGVTGISPRLLHTQWAGMCGRPVKLSSFHMVANYSQRQ